MEYAKSIAMKAEAKAGDGGSFEEIISVLRHLSLDDFGRLMISLPNPEFPALSATLPPMASEETQRSWTGSAGIELLKQTTGFMRLLETNFIRHHGAPLQGSTILDFGCGYGRFVRLLYYYTDPQNIWGIDAWDRSLQHCYDAGLKGNFGRSEPEPDDLPVGDAQFDLAFAYSIFTHLAPATATKCLAAIRRHMNLGGVLVATIRPVEFWAYLDQVRSTSEAPRLVAQHSENGLAYLPHQGPEGETYGDISVHPRFLAQDGWELLSYDSSLGDAYQISVILKAVQPTSAARLVRRQRQK